MSDAVPETTRLLAEIEEEVRRKRASGELPADFEREMDLTFARYAPVDAVDGDFDSIVAKLQASTIIDTRASTESSRKGVAQVKTGVAKAIGWYVSHIAAQTSGLFHATAKALRLLGDRVDSLEQSSPLATTEAWRQARAAYATQDDLLPPGPWTQLAIETMSNTTGRVLHAEAGDGSLVQAMQSAGIEAYGVEPDDDLALAAADRADDIRADEAISHLRLLTPASLGGLVLSGCVERLPAGRLIELLDLATSRLAPGCPLLIVSPDPSVWALAKGAVSADLSPGRPLSAHTWRALLDARSYAEPTLYLGPRPAGLELVPGDHPIPNTLNANLARLNDLLFGPVSYAVPPRRAW